MWSRVDCGNWEASELGGLLIHNEAHWSVSDKRELNGGDRIPMP